MRQPVTRRSAICIHLFLISLQYSFAQSAASDRAVSARHSAAAAHSSTQPMVLWYQQPAEQWTEALPIGNGRLGAMVFGKADVEHLQLNEDTVWAGKRMDRDNPEALKNLPEVRRLLFAGKPLEAQKLAEEKLMGIPKRQPPYQPLGDLWLKYSREPAEVKDYRRELDMDSGVARVSYSIGNDRYTEEVFSSAVDQVLVIHLTCSHPGRISLFATLNREQDSKTVALGNDGLAMSGEAITHDDTRHPQEPKQGVKFYAVLRAIAEGGAVRTAGDEVVVDEADSLTLLLAAATDLKGKDPQKSVEHDLQAAKKSFEQLRAAHIADHQKFFRRAELVLDESAASKPDIPTDERLKRVQAGGSDLLLEEQYFQFGRYLLMASSRPGSMAANLQGIWNKSLTPPWDSKYTININIEMNYWPAELTNLAEMSEP